MPESPRWLVQQDRQQEALEVLARLHSKGDTNDAYVRAELTEIIAKLRWEKSNPPTTYSSMLFGAEARRTWLAIGVVCCSISFRVKCLLMWCSNSGNKSLVSTCKS